VSYFDVNGVHTYYEEHGAGDPLLLLHGGLSNADDMGMQTPALAERYRVIVPERRAHGRTADVDGPITYDLMADDTIALMDALDTGPAHLVGWSDGGNVALLVAIKRPDLVRRIVTMGSNSAGDGYAEGVRDLFRPDGPVVPTLREGWVKHAPDGEEHFPVVIEKMTECWFETYDIPSDQLARIAVPTLIMVGDDDIIRFEHTLDLYETVPDAQLAVIPGASHLAPIEKPELVNQLILDFLAAEGPTTTMMPIRRG
jgi:pimeloyl-ACP methyl ester carboxylesterase